jgi:tetratricopeptide (TPR) repeat protein
MITHYSPASKWITALVLFLIAAGVFANTLQNDFVYDDEMGILNNPWIKNTAFLPKIFLTHSWGFKMTDLSTSHYNPLRFVVNLLQFRFFQNDPQGYHLTNIVIHGLVTCLVFLAGLVLFEHVFHEKNLLFPALASLIFAVHPVHTEAVAWISAMGELLMSFFCLLSFYVYILRAKKKTYYQYFISALLFFLAALSKITAMTLPVLLILYDYSFRNGIFENGLSRRLAAKELLLRYGPFVVAGGAYFLLRTFAIEGVIYQKGNYSTFEVALNVFPLFSKYLIMLILPIKLNILHVFHPVSSLFDTRLVLSVLVTVFFGAIVIVTIKKERSLFFSLGWIVITLLPVLYFPAFHTESVFAERYLYLPSVGFVISLAILAGVFHRNRAFYGKQTYLWVCLVVITCLFMVQTISRNRSWKNNYTLWEDSLKTSPDSYTAHTGFGYALSGRREFDRAIFHYQEALRINPYSVDAYNSLGAAFYWEGRFDEALMVYKKVLMLTPDFYEVYNNIGNILRTTGQLDEAIWYYKKTIQINPDYAFAYNNLGLALYDKGLLDDARISYIKALQLNPAYAFAHNNLGVVMQRMGQLQEAEREFQTALALLPDYREAANNLAALQRQMESRHMKK